MKNIPELRQPAIAGLVDGTLDPDSVPNGAQVSVFYDDMLRDDQVEVRWITSSPTASFTRTLPVLADGTPLNFTVPYPVLDAGRGLNATVDYTAVRNGATRQSYAQTVAVQSIPAPWPQPRVLDATGNEVNPFNPIHTATGGENTATVAIADTRLAVGDVVAVLWFLPNGDLPLIPNVRVTSAGQLRVTVPREVIAQSLDRLTRLNYEVFRGAVTIGTSPDLSLRVMGIELLPASILEADEYGVLDVANLTADAFVQLRAWPFMARQQWVTLEVTGTTDELPTRVVLAQDEEVSTVSDIEKRLSLSWLNTLKHASTVTVSAKVKLGSQGDVIKNVTKSYTIQAFLDLTPLINVVRDSQGDVPRGETTFDSNLTLVGTAAPNQRVEIFTGASTLGIATINGAGEWIHLGANLSVGRHGFVAKALYGSGRESEQYVLTIAQNVAPSIVAIKDYHNGNIAADGYITSRVLFEGYAAADQQVHLIDNNTVLATTTTNSAGIWAVQTQNLPLGVHLFKVKAAYGNGLESAERRLTIVADVQVPTIANFTGQSQDYQLVGGHPPFVEERSNVRNFEIKWRGDPQTSRIFYLKALTRSSSNYFRIWNRGSLDQSNNFNVTT